MVEDKEFQKKLAIYQIAATAGSTLGSIIIALGISMIIFSTELSLEAISDDESKSQFFRIISGGYLYQGIITFFAGLAVLLLSLISISRTIKKLK